jgi:hypothetical protein
LPTEFHPLAYHLLDVAACADAILDANLSRLRFLADLCEIETDKFARWFVWSRCMTSASARADSNDGAWNTAPIFCDESP